jgi:hypothetical protein
MSIKSRNQLKTQFVSGTAATQDKFNDVFDSSYNRNDDFLLQGPLGQTGANGLVGPTGATHYTGLWIDTLASTGPTGATAPGATGQVIFEGSSMYICTGLDTWTKFTQSAF